MNGSLIANPDQIPSHAEQEHGFFHKRKLDDLGGENYTSLFRHLLTLTFVDLGCDMN